MVLYAFFRKSQQKVGIYFCDNAILSVSFSLFSAFPLLFRNSRTFILCAWIFISKGIVFYRVAWLSLWESQQTEGLTEKASATPSPPLRGTLPKTETMGCATYKNLYIIANADGAEMLLSWPPRK